MGVRDRKNQQSLQAESDKVQQLHAIWVTIKDAVLNSLQELDRQRERGLGGR